MDPDLKDMSKRSLEENVLQTVEVMAALVIDQIALENYIIAVVSDVVSVIIR